MCRFSAMLMAQGGDKTMKDFKLRQYCQLVSFLGRALGPDYEVVLTDLHSILAISNGHVSGRSVGGPLSDVALKILQTNQLPQNSSILNYQGRGINGKILRCSTFFLKTATGRLEGLLCVNFDDSRYHELARKVFGLCHPDSYAGQNVEISQITQTGSETFYSDLSTLIEDMFSRVSGKSDVAGEKLTYREKLRIVLALYQNGVFSVKGTIPEVSARLGVSTATLYRYISKVKKEA